MNKELESYGFFVMYNGMKKSCELSCRTSGFLLKALYCVVGKKNSTKFFLNGIRDFIRKSSSEEIISVFLITEDQFNKCIQGNDWVLSHEKSLDSKAKVKGQKKQNALNHIGNYKDLEISKSIIFKHLKITNKNLASE